MARKLLLSSSLVILVLGLTLSTILAKDPGTTVQFTNGVKVAPVDVKDLLQKIEDYLANPDEGVGPFGAVLAQFNQRETQEFCLDASGLPQATTTVSKATYVPYPSTACNVMSSNQRWTLVSGMLQANKAQLKAIPNTTPEACVDCVNRDEACDLQVIGCKAGEPAEQFFVRMHPAQWDVNHKRIHFSIHSTTYKSSCLTSYRNASQARQMYHLAECTGTEEQSFYLATATNVVGKSGLMDVDFAEEWESIKNQVDQGTNKV